jgi:hypothetical protein
MNMQVIRELIDSESLSGKIENAETFEEQQLIMLVVIRNNLNFLRDDLKTIKNWVMFFGIVSILSVVLTIVF